MKKKIYLLVLAAGVLGLAACQGTETSSNQGSAPSSTSASSVPKPVDVFYADDTFVYAGESDAGSGRFVYWAGDGGAVSSAAEAQGRYTLSYSSKGNWYGIQLFYKLPYAVTGDTYHVSFDFTSDVAGNITINSKTVAAVAGSNSYVFDMTQGKGATISIQLGVASPASTLGGASFSFALPVINDTNANASYHLIQFLDGANLIKAIEVKDGKTVTAPSDPMPAAGYIFDGWYSGAVAFDAGAAVTAALTYTAKYILEADVTRYAVTLKSGDVTLGTFPVIKGHKIIVPSTIAIPFGYGASGWYTDAGLTSAWDLATDVVTADLILYAKLLVTPTGTFMNATDTGNVIPAANISHGADGSLIVSGFPGWAQAAWVVQVNFGPVPSGVKGTNYEIKFDYKINAAGADAKIFDNNATIGNLVALTTTSAWTTATIDFAGGVTTPKSKLTFELGATPAATNLDFELNNIALAAKLA